VPAYVCALVKEKTKKPFIFDMHGLQAQEAKFRGESSSRINFLEEVERVTVDRADLVVVMSRAMRNFVADNYGTPPDRFIVIPNGSTPYPTRARYDKPLRVVYGGIIDYYERVEDFVAAGQILQGGDYQFVMMGDGRLRNKVLDHINNNRVDIIYIGRKSREESLKRFSQMQVGVAPSTKDITRRVASPIKVLDYAACGLPVVTVDVGEWSDLVSKHDAGIVVAKSDAKEFATAIEQLSDKSLWMQKSSNAVRMVQEECLWEKVLQPLTELYRRWLG
jgi:glycosyltransferase involved in cell wall biosynthesis